MPQGRVTSPGTNVAAPARPTGVAGVAGAMAGLGVGVGGAYSKHTQSHTNTL